MDNKIIHTIGRGYMYKFCTCLFEFEIREGATSVKDRAVGQVYKKKFVFHSASELYEDLQRI